MKALAHFVPRAGAEAEFDSRLPELASALAERGRERGIEVTTLARLAEDPFGRHTPFRFTFELRSEDFVALEDCLSGLGAQLDDVAHADLSTLLVGEEVVFLPAENAPVRYQYLMRRNAAFSHADYLERYREVHSAFGLKTPGIAGYLQFHVDIESSRRLANAAQLGIWGFDSVSELHLESLQTFLTAVAKSEIGPEAIADEERFVDRARSVDFCSRVVS
jgi:hypothetical protein